LLAENLLVRLFALRLGATKTIHKVIHRYSG